jgi:hypothetical protein
LLTLPHSPACGGVSYGQNLWALGHLS